MMNPDEAENIFFSRHILFCEEDDITSNQVKEELMLGMPVIKSDYKARHLLSGCIQAFNIVNRTYYQKITQETDEQREEECKKELEQKLEYIRTAFYHSI